MFPVADFHRRYHQSPRNDGHSVLSGKQTGPWTLGQLSVPSGSCDPDSASQPRQEPRVASRIIVVIHQRYRWQFSVALRIMGIIATTTGPLLGQSLLENTVARPRASVSHLTARRASDTEIESETTSENCRLFLYINTFELASVLADRRLQFRSASVGHFTGHFMKSEKYSNDF